MCRTGECGAGWPGPRRRLLDLVNLHLFHDESNLAFLDSPHVYSDNRRRALLWTLQRYEEFVKADTSKDTSKAVPLFLFGDFNFRLNASALVQRLTPGTRRLLCDSDACRAEEDSPKTSSDDSDAQSATNGTPDRPPTAAVEFRRDGEDG